MTLSLKKQTSALGTPDHGPKVHQLGKHLSCVLCHTGYLSPTKISPEGIDPIIRPCISPNVVTKIATQGLISHWICELSPPGEVGIMFYLSVNCDNYVVGIKAFLELVSSFEKSFLYYPSSLMYMYFHPWCKKAEPIVFSCIFHASRNKTWFNIANCGW